MVRVNTGGPSSHGSDWPYNGPPSPSYNALERPSLSSQSSDDLPPPHPRKVHTRLSAGGVNIIGKTHSVGTQTPSTRNQTEADPPRTDADSAAYMYMYQHRYWMGTILVISVLVLLKILSTLYNLHTDISWIRHYLVNNNTHPTATISVRPVRSRPITAVYRLGRTLGGLVYRILLKPLLEAVLFYICILGVLSIMGIRIALRRTVDILNTFGITRIVTSWIPSLPSLRPPKDVRSPRRL
eukprot:GHVO01049762.1.p1 GENE.GHVO01049762.1~~GHVO01049762.1.p1  ORF type:complete len:240 (+),score=20.98 GHVO01049762.1:49-768(+)